MKGAISVRLVKSTAGLLTFRYVVGPKAPDAFVMNVKFGEFRSGSVPTVSRLMLAAEIRPAFNASNAQAEKKILVLVICKE